jgi:putative heme-binding domain-containing protein
MKAMPALLFIALAVLGQPLARAVEFSIGEKEVVAFVGGTNVGRAQEDGSLEAMLTHVFAKKEPVFRDMSWDADTVYRQGSVIERWRKNGFGDRVEQLDREKISLIIAQFGQLESMQGVEKLEDFAKAYNRLIDDYLKQARRVVLVTPLAFEKPRSSLLLDLTVHNPTLALYVGKIREMASERKLVFVDLFTGGPRGWTGNGMHLSADVHEKAAALWMKRAGLKVPPLKEIEALREAVREKNRLWFDYWRPANWKLLFGDDSRRQFTRGGKNYVPFREEWKRLLPLIAKADGRIRKVAAGEPDSGNDRPDPEILHGDEEADVEKETKAFEVGYGLRVNLFADEKLGLTNPLAVRWDPNGRAYVSVTTAYPHVFPGDVFNDKILILEDTDGDGQADKSIVFAEGLNIPTGFELGDGGVYVGESTKITFLEDTDGDDRADRKKVLLSGFGSGDAHQAINSFVWSPGGDLFMGQGDGVESRVETPLGSSDLYQAGIYRFRPRRLRLDPLLDNWMGPANPWGMAFDEWGQMFVVDGAGGVSCLSPGQVPAQNRLKLPRIGNPGGYCGIGYLDGGHLPEELQGRFATGDFKANRIKVFSLSDQGAGFKLKWEEPLLRSSHRNFRPVDVNVGPDGAIYVVDWYNSITCHQDDAYRDPRRDKAHGRIWRISSKSPVLVPPKLGGAPLRHVLDGLKASDSWTRGQARRELSNRGTEEVAEALDEWIESLDPKDARHERYLYEALAASSSIEVVRESLLRRVAKSNVAGARAFAARIAGRWEDRIDDPLDLLVGLARDENPRVRMEAVLATGQIPKMDSIKVVAIASEREMDRSIEYAFTQAVHHLMPHWEEPFEKGRLTFSKLSHVAAVLNRAGSKNMVGKLRGVADNGTLSKDERKGAMMTLLALGGPREFRDYGLDREKFISGGKYDPNSHAVLLARLIEATRERGVRPEGELVEPLLELLDSGHEGVLAHALTLTGLWSVRQVEGKVLRCARDKNLGVELRATAFLSLVRMNSKQAKAILKEFSETGNPSAIRVAAIEAMCLTDLPEAAKRSAGLIVGGPLSETELGSLLKAFLSRTSGEDRLVEALKPVDLEQAVSDRLLQALYLSGHLSGKLSELFGGKVAKKSEPLTPDEKTISELVRLAREKGDPNRGKLASLSCLGCHRIGSQGGLVGPDLTSLGTTLSPERIVEELLWPGRQVKEGYSMIQLTTKSGEILQGYERSAKPGEIAIRQLAEDSFLTLRRDRILSIKKLGSAMPPNLTTGMPRQRLLDLIQYLVQLGKTENNGNHRK